MAQSVEGSSDKGFQGILRHPLLILVIGGLITYGVGEAIKDSYQESRSKGAFSLQVVSTAWKRLFWTRTFIERVRLGASQEAVEAAWGEYVGASEEWNTQLMGNIQLLEHYYPGSGKRKIFSEEIQPLFGVINKQLVAIVYSPTPAGSRVSPQKLRYLDDQTDELNRRLYKFAQGLDVQFSN
jgi:hypothetical protein